MEFITELLAGTNEILSSAIVVLAASLLLYNLTRDRGNRIAQTSGIVLACVTVVSVFDVFIQLGPQPDIYILSLKLQWFGIALIPAAMFHLSDALLDTTGLYSRGRRKRVVNILYGLGLVFFVAVLFTELVATPKAFPGGVSMLAGPLFLLYLIYFIVVNAVALYNVERARRRSITRRWHRQLLYLQMAMLTAPLSIFPYSMLLADPGQVFSLAGLVIVNVTNFVVVLMLVFLSYPLSFLGSSKPDRVVKAELLRFLLRGPGTALLALVVIVSTARASRIFGLPGEDFMPFATVSVILLWQWGIHLALPYLEAWLIYRGDDSEQLTRLSSLSERLLSREDLTQFIEVNVDAMVDLLRIEQAFLIRTQGAPDVIYNMGEQASTDELLERWSSDPWEQDDAKDVLTSEAQQFGRWQEYWVAPVTSRRILDASGARGITGVLGFFPQPSLSPGEDAGFLALQKRIEKGLDDVLLQEEVLAVLEGLLPQVSLTRTRTQAMALDQNTECEPVDLPVRAELFEQVRAALRHYWGGPGITRSGLVSLRIVQDAIQAQPENPVQILRNLLLEAIEKLRPEGERQLMAPEWTFYNILTLRYIEGKKVRYVTRNMSMSEADMFRKQRAAIEAVAATIYAMEREYLQNSAAQPPVVQG
jgi:hypothetical protein